MLLNCGVGENSWVPWTARRSNQSVLKEISPKRSLEGLMLMLKLHYLGRLMQITGSLEKTLILGKKWMTEDEMVGWHHWLNGCGFKQAPEVGDGQGGLACCDSWGCEESDTTERLHWTELNWWLLVWNIFSRTCWPSAWLLWRRGLQFIQVFCPFLKWVVSIYDVESYELFIYFGY